jgi:signal transduction histidine kinase
VTVLDYGPRPGNRPRPRRIRGMTGDVGPVWPGGLLGGRATWIAATAFAVMVAVGFALGRTYADRNSVVEAVIAAVAAIGAGVLLARSWPPLLAYAAVATAGIAVVGDGRSYNVGWFAVCLLAGWCTLAGGRRDGLAYLGGVLALFAAEWLWVRPDPGWAAWMGGSVLTVLAGLLIRHQIDLVAQLREAQAGLAEKTRVEERNRVARELHDVIGHTLVVSLLHVQSARLAVEHDPADAARALAEAERLGRECLAEVRTTVGMLREDERAGSDGATAPLPGVDGLPALVERFRSAGADITLTVEGDTAGLPATTGLAVYRIAQEALTNAAKHAPGAPTEVRLTVGAGRVTLTADSRSVAGADSRSVPGAGLGVVSMRERAESLGGTCQAGPGGHGWLVRATLPLGVPSPEARSSTARSSKARSSKAEP